TVIAVLSSLMVARLLTPMMAAYFLKTLPKKVSGDGPVMVRYLKAVRWCLAHRLQTVAGAVLFLLASFAMVPFIPVGLIPAADRGSANIEIELPPGSSVNSTLAVAEAARVALSGVP